MPKSKEFKDSSESDSDGDNTPKAKKFKPEKKPEKKKSSEGASADSGDGLMQLSKMRFVSVSEFRGKKLVNIREYYDADGEMKPGKKGISLNRDQWEALKKHMDAIDEQLE